MRKKEAELKIVQDECDLAREKNLVNLTSICSTTKTIKNQLKSGLKGTLKIRDVKMNMQNVKASKKGDFSLFVIFRVLDQHYKTDIFQVKGSNQVKVQFLKEFELTSKQGFCLQVEVYDQIGEGKNKFLCGNTLYLTQYEKQQESNVNLQLYKYCT